MNCDMKNYNASHGGLDKNKDRWKDEVKKSKQYDSCSNTCMYNDCYTGTCWRGQWSEAEEAGDTESGK